MPAAPTAKIHSSKAKVAAGDGFHPIRWVRRFFTRPLKVKRVGMQLQVVFDQSRLEEPNSKAPSRGESLRLGHVALQSLLSQHDDARHVVPHLDAFEQSLARNGSRALTTLPLKVLSRAMDQLDMIEGTQRSEALMALRVRVDEAVRRRTPVNMKGDIANIEVRDASPSQFDEAEVHWTNRMELDAIYSEAGATTR